MSLKFQVKSEPEKEMFSVYVRNSSDCVSYYLTLSQLQEDVREYFLLGVKSGGRLKIIIIIIGQFMRCCNVAVVTTTRSPITTIKRASAADVSCQ